MRLRITTIVIGFIGLLFPIEMSAADSGDDAAISDTIAKWIGEEEGIKAKERAELAALPIAAVPLLTDLLLNAPLENSLPREFKLLALKVTQHEPFLQRNVRDDAVAALLARIDPKAHQGRVHQAQLRNKLEDLSRIEDPRIVEGVRKARVFLGLEQETAGEIPQRALHQSAAEVSEMEKKGRRQMQTGPGKAGQTASTLWPAWVAMALGSLGLLWLFLKPKAASERAIARPENRPPFA